VGYEKWHNSKRMQLPPPLILHPKFRRPHRSLGVRSRPPVTSFHWADMTTFAGATALPIAHSLQARFPCPEISTIPFRPLAPPMTGPLGVVFQWMISAIVSHRASCGQAHLAREHTQCDPPPT